MSASMAVDIVTAFQTKASMKNKHFPGSPRSLSPRAHDLTIRLPNSKVLKLFACLLLLVLIFASLPWLRSLIGNSSLKYPQAMPTSEELSPDSMNFKIFSLFFRDLTKEGLLKKTGQKAIFLSNENAENFSEILSENNMDFISLNDLEKQNSISDETIDFIFTSDFPAASKFINRALKNGGVVTVLLNDNPSSGFYNPSNYKIAYLRRFDLTALAIRKTGIAGVLHATQRKLFSHAWEAKKAALQKLEDVLLEPPRAASQKSNRYLKRTKYLPDLMGDSLENYPRRVFIDVGLPEKEGGSGTDWFPKNYPTRNKNFEIYKIETVTEETSGKKEVSQIGMSDWLTKNVKDEEYVVMKAEAEVVEEIMRNKATMLIDELFLECKPQIGKNRKQGKSNRGRPMAYWECLALYGRLRDEGVAVHQWWG